MPFTTPPPVDVKQVAKWARQIKDERARRQLTKGVLRMSNQIQVVQAEDRALMLLNGRHPLAVIRDDMRVMARVGRYNEDILHPTVAGLRGWLNQPGFPWPMPFHNQPMPPAGSMPWRPCTKESRRKDQQTYVDILTPTFRTTTNTDADAIAAARALVDQAGLIVLGDAEEKTRPDPKPEDFEAWWKAHHKHRYHYPEVRAQIAFAAEVLEGDGNRIPALVNAPLDGLHLEDDAFPARIICPPGPFMKTTQTLYLSPRALAAAHVYVELHPFRKFKAGFPEARNGYLKPPLMPIMRFARKGRVAQMDECGLTNHLYRIGKEGGLTMSWGSRAIRHGKHADMATDGDSEDDINLYFKKDATAPSTADYVNFPQWRSWRFMARQRGMPLDPVAGNCVCGSKLPTGTSQCVTVGCKNAKPAATVADHLRVLSANLPKTTSDAA